MSIHIAAGPGEIAEAVLMPGDPLRAKHIAETFLEGAVRYNEVRNMFGYTGTYKGKRISVQGSGMGIPSFSIYATELMKDYGCQTLIRVGTCGAMREDVAIRDIVIGQAACTDSSLVPQHFPDMTFAPIADFDLLAASVAIAGERGQKVRVGNIYSSDIFYSDDTSRTKKLGDFGVLAVEMEAAALYTLAAKYGRRALTILTVSDHLITGEQTSAQERQTSFNGMMELALETVVRKG